MNFANKYIFWLTWILLISILTGINNYYFYSHAQRSSGRDADQLKLLLENEKIRCKINNLDKQTCQSNILSTVETFSEKAYYNRTLNVFDKDGNLLWKKADESMPKDITAGSDISIALDDGNVNYKSSTYMDISAFMMSIVNSMTFSCIDIAKITYESGFKKALDKFDNMYWYRSRPAIGFAVFSFLILWAYRKREKQLIELQLKKEQELIESFKQQSLTTSNIVSDEDLYRKFVQFEHIINPPINTILFREIIAVDTGGMGNKFRQTLEKIFFKILKTKLNMKAKDLSEAIYFLHTQELISEKAKNYSNLIRVYGNIDSHYSEDTEISQDEIKLLAFRLMSVIEEVVEKNLFPIEDAMKNSGVKPKKIFDKQTQKWVAQS